MAYLEFDLLRSLVEIADSGSFAKAAERVHRSQSAVSMQMRRLEAQLGRELFVKSGRRAVLTDDGRQLLLAARQLLNLHDKTLAMFSDSSVAGRVSLGVCDDYVRCFAPAILTRFRQLYPNVNVSIESNTSEHLRHSIQEKRVDIALINVAASVEKGCIVQHEPMVWVVAEGLDIHRQRPLPLALEGNPLWSKWITRSLDSAGIAYNVVYTTHGFSGVEPIVNAGLAVSVLPRVSVTSSMRVLCPSEGFPTLPSTEIGLLVASTQSSALVSKMAHMIEQIITDVSSNYDNQSGSDRAPDSDRF